jgi:two-component system NtrC family sensor kinase
LVYALTALVVLLSVAGWWIFRLYRSQGRLLQSQSAFRRAHQNLATRALTRADRLKKLGEQLHLELEERAEAEARLHDTERLLHDIIDSMPSVIIGVTPEGQVTHWNARAEAVTTITEADALGQHISDVLEEVTQEDIERAIAEGLPQIRENVVRGLGQTAEHMDITIYPLTHEEMPGAVIRIDDVTMRVQLESTMIQNEKMSSLGKLAAGTAHEINNPLSTILQNVQNIERRLFDDLEQNQSAANGAGASLEALQAYARERQIDGLLNAIRSDGARAAAIVSRMLGFSRQTTPTDAKPANLNHVVQEAITLAHYALYGDNPYGHVAVKVQTHFDPDLPDILLAGNELQQVIINLIQNAVHAVGEKEWNEGEYPLIQVSTRRLPQHAEITVEDNGPGIDEAVQTHIFEPFFTTKEVGAGTGLGLSISYFIVTEHHRGEIEVESSPGEGTRFVITLPLAA